MSGVIEKNIMWQEQMVKGMVQGLDPKVWNMIVKLILRCSKLIASTDWGKVESMNESYLQGYNLSQQVMHELWAEVAQSMKV